MMDAALVRSRRVRPATGMDANRVAAPRPATADPQHDIRQARRILVLGAPGSGKTQFSRRLGELLDLPVHHLDDIYWGPGWQRPRETVFEARQRPLVAGDRWIIDGLHARSLALRMSRAQAVILLDPATSIVLLRFAARALRRLGGERASLPRSVGATPGWRSLLRWDLRIWWKIARFRTATLPRIRTMLSSMPRGTVCVRLSCRADCDRFLDAVRAP